ncbi:MAG TPA: efflux RND transporter permease subunit [Fimbriiglobus sp.]|jgi:multidrug efflux pump
MFTRFFVDRPIFASVLSILLTLAGGVAAFTLPIAQYPDIAPPTVEVSAVYPGANARDVSDTVASPIEQQVNGVEDMLYMSSQCTNDGSYTLTVTFRPGIDLNVAQVLVQNRVNLALPVLPDLVRRRGVMVKKKSPTTLMIVNLFSPDDSRSSLDMSNYATIQLRDELARLPGVGDISFLGQRDYSMRVWLDPEKVASRGLSAGDVVKAVEQQNVQVAAGKVGQPPIPTGQAFQFSINTRGRLTEPAEFEDMILATDRTGRVVRLKDVARVELGAIGYDQTCTLDGKPSVAMSIYQLPGSNAIETANRVREKMAELKTRFPAGVDYAVVYDTTPFVRESIREVFVTLRDAVLLVAGVMLLFLQSWRAAIIPLAAVPVAIVGTFAAMSGFGFSLNTLTLFGLVLAVGIVVDDAIVVVEAVEHHLAGGMTPRDATLRAMSEVAGPVVAVGLVLAAVFVPCLFVGGVVGQFFRQFAVTIAVSTLISAFNSLTLSPALCALLLRHSGTGRQDPLPRVVFPLLGAAAAYFYLVPLLNPLWNRLPVGWQNALEPARTWLVPIVAGLVGASAGQVVSKLANRILGLVFRTFNSGFDKVTSGYLFAVRGLLFVTPLALLAYGGLLYQTYRTLDSAPTGFIPSQDKGYLLVNVQLPDAASLPRTDAAIHIADQIARATPGVRHTVAVAGQSALLGANAPNLGSLYVMLDNFPDRLAPDRSADAIAAKLRQDYTANLIGAIVTVLGAPPVDGLGTAGGLKQVILDPAAGDSRILQQAGQQTAEALEAEGFSGVFSGFRADTPWLTLDIDRDQALARGVSIGEVNSALQVYFGSLYVNDFNRFGRTWEVNLQADADTRNRADKLRRLFVRNSDGEIVPLAAFSRVRDSAGPLVVQRYNLYPASTVNLTPPPGMSSGEAMARAEKVAADLPPGLRAEWTELAYLQQSTGSTTTAAFVLSVVLVFLVLAAQYESWSLPLAVILVVPLCLLSAGFGVLLANLDVNVFTQVGFVVLVGLACKNAILIVEFARARHVAGATRKQAVLEACKLRLRPIVMTSVAFILGVLPLLVSEGAGSEMRRTLGTAVFAGMLGVTLFGIFLTPVFFLCVQWVTDRFARLASTSPTPDSPARV